MDAFCLGVPESLTLTVKVNLPLTVGVPESSPVVALSVMPAGRLPDTSFHLYGASPPWATRYVTYGECSVPWGTRVVRIVSGATTSTHSPAEVSELPV